MTGPAAFDGAIGRGKKWKSEGQGCAFFFLFFFATDFEGLVVVLPCQVPDLNSVASVFGCIAISDQKKLFSLSPWRWMFLLLCPLFFRKVNIYCLLFD